ncbi:30S ribosomal protein S3 [Candidatus Peregrinibacteria bacterium]|nr:30S ribosomal protein S3 [Candidatus Peregrinibacteria bacterium]
MGTKVNPIGMRTGIIRNWPSSWYANKKNYAKMLKDDVAIKSFVRKSLNDCGVSMVELQRNANDTILNVYTSKPGVIIGKQGAGVEVLKGDLEKKFGSKFTLNVKEIKRPDLDAFLVGDSIAKQIERRVSYRRAAKMAVRKAMEAGALGIKVKVSGRLNGVEIARTEFTAEGKIPLHTFRADIDYASVPAFTTYGAIGVKVWINRGEIFIKK